MTEDGAAGDEISYSALRAKADDLERRLGELQTHSDMRLRTAELKGEALRAGIVDLDGLRLLDPELLARSGGEVFDPIAVVSKLRREKPWLFGATNSSSGVAAPATAPARRRLATDMTTDEWRIARAEILRRK